MKRLLAYFLRGLVFVVPIAITAYVCWVLFTRIDGWLGDALGLPIPGAGFLLTVVLITLIGFMASNYLTRSLMGVVDRMLDRLPFVRFLYSATRDLLNAFVGEKRRFDAPVLVALSADGAVRTLGFVTRPSLAALGLPGDVAVYLPQSYNFAGSLLIVPAARVVAVTRDSAEVMAFIVSGGVTELG